MRLLPTYSIICVLTASFSVATETVVGMAGRRVTLPCSSEAESKAGVCWGRGKPSLFTCHNTLLVTNGVQVTHSASYRYKLLSDAPRGDVSMSIHNIQQADSGFYHCRVQVPGLFNDQVYLVHLIITEAPKRTVEPPSALLLTASEVDLLELHQTPSPLILLGFTETGAVGSGDVCCSGDHPEDSVVAPVKTSKESDFQQNGPESFIGNTLRLSLIIFIPALLLIIGYIAECDLEVVGTVGNNVTLPCKYDVKTYGVVPICWGRGDIPYSKCNSQLTSTDGVKVSIDSPGSSRYRLLGNLEKGDVSMTILNVSKTDSGLYGCRVEVEGWFNDQRYHFQLRVQKATEPTTSWTLDDVTSTEQTPFPQAAAINATRHWETSNPEIIFAEEERSGNSLVLLVCILLVAFIAVGGVTVYFVAECDLEVVGTVGNNVTLPCKYDVKTYGVVPICWGRGVIPYSKCNSQLTSTDGAKLSKDSPGSSRYRLLGNLEKGNVSMTILNVSETDSGLYGCRVEVEGWFNDQRYHFQLRVQKATEPTTSWTLDDVTSTEQTPFPQAAAINATWHWETSNPEIIFAQEERSGNSLVLLVCILLVAFIAVGGVTVYFASWSPLVSSFKVAEGGVATLSCQYSVKRFGLSRVCWGRSCGTFWCSDILVQTDENGIISKLTDRYRLTGDVLDGQIDLSIQNVRRTDSGPYCCRVNIDGIFNDKKVVMNLRVVKATWRNILSSHLELFRRNSTPLHSGTVIMEDSVPTLSLQINVPVLSLSLCLLLLVAGSLILLALKCGIHRRASMKGCFSSKEPPHIIYEIRMRRPIQENIYTLD
ncbi:hypothetical protein NHX12_010001 [Muraenolepis orangiensis]|uniref:Ig-like domain-containing protein n=1 Tax=Muraenolepis orangiensis TaxID=630683 RepID=A0A9Q0I8W9_9TELE|nr:hypothetical protein NHX12_010001 [Muraenolepis orangiensis]